MQRIETTAPFRPARLALATLVVLALSACGGGTEEDEPSSSSATSAANCNYSDLIDSAERQQANVCGIQVSANYAQADHGLASVVAACKAGEKAKADAYYAGTYRQMVDYARQVSRTLSCGSGNNGPALPDPSTPSYYNFCVTPHSSAGRITYTGACYGPVRQHEGGCGTETSLIAQYQDSATCLREGQKWMNSH